jgi:hypothetical protein
MAISLNITETNLGRIVRAICEVIAGRSNNIGSLTLRAGHATTVVDKSVAPGVVNCGPKSMVLLSPTTLNAAAALATTYVSSKGIQTFTLTHANAVSTDRTFDFEVRG